MILPEDWTDINTKAHAVFYNDNAISIYID